MDSRNRQPLPVDYESYTDDDDGDGDGQYGQPHNLEGHKIMITATSVKFLDILHEAIRRVAKLRYTY